MNSAINKLAEMIPVKKAAPKTGAASTSSTTAAQTAQPKILGRLKMGHRVIILKKKIGQGGYAAAYLAQDENTYKQFVLKRMDCKVWCE
jgi:serine/threonine protein kinase